MGPLEINAFYRQQQLLDEARENGLARSARTTRSRRPFEAASGLLGRLFRSGELRVGRGATAAAPHKATI